MSIIHGIELLLFEVMTTGICLLISSSGTKKKKEPV